ENVNFSRRVLTVPRSKNGEVRHVPLNSPALAALAELRKRGDGTGPVIRNPQGEPLAGPRHWFEPPIRKAKIRAFSWHCLRHTFASRLIMAGVDLRTVQELMGHKSIQMTVRYAHLAPTYQLAAVARLADVSQATQSGSLAEPVVKGATDTKTSTSDFAEQVAQPAYV